MLSQIAGSQVLTGDHKQKLIEGKVFRGKAPYRRYDDDDDGDDDEELSWGVGEGRR